MRDVRDNVLKNDRIDERLRIDPFLRPGLELLDDEIRNIIARMSAKALEAGSDVVIFSQASSTVLLSIAATLTGNQNNPCGKVDIADFLTRASKAAEWANNRQTRQIEAN